MLVDTALIRHLAWKPPYATGVALEKANREKKNEMHGLSYCLSSKTPLHTIGPEHLLSLCTPQIPRTSPHPLSYSP